MMNLQHAARTLALYLSVVGSQNLTPAQRIRHVPPGLLATKGRRGNTSMLSVGGLIGGIIFLYLFAQLVPGAVTQLNDANTTGWTAQQIAVYSILGLVVLAGAAYAIWSIWGGGR